MISWLSKPVAGMTPRNRRVQFYLVAIILVAASVPFFHLYMDDPLSPAEVAAHALSVALSTAIAILLFELMLRIYLEKKLEGGGLSTGLFWLLLLGVFALSFAIMHMTHDLFPVTLDIWNKHIKQDLMAKPWKLVPIVLLIGYVLIQFIRRYQTAQELADLKRLNEQLQAVRSGVGTPDSSPIKSQRLGVSKFVLPYQGGHLYLNPALIIRVESNENYCHIFVAPNEKQGEYCHMARITLIEVISQLPKDLFLQVHRSHVVNFSCVDSLVRQGRSYQLGLTNGDKIPISRSRIKQVRNKVLAL